MYLFVHNFLLISPSFFTLIMFISQLRLRRSNIFFLLSKRNILYNSKRVHREKHLSTRRQNATKRKHIQQTVGYTPHTTLQSYFLNAIQEKLQLARSGIFFLIYYWVLHYFCLICLIQRFSIHMFKALISQSESYGTQPTLCTFSFYRN